MNFQGSRAHLLLVLKEAWPLEVHGDDWPVVPAAQIPEKAAESAKFTVRASSVTGPVG